MDDIDEIDAYEIDLVRASRPTPPGPTATERARAEEHLMQLIDHATTSAAPAPEPVTARSGHRRRGRTLVGAAACLAVLAGAAVVGTGSGPFRAAPSAAAELHHAADLLAATPFPEGKFSVDVKYAAENEDGSGHGDGALTATTYVLSAHDAVIASGPCTPFESALCHRVPMTAQTDAIGDLDTAATKAAVEKMVDQLLADGTDVEQASGRDALRMQVAAQQLMTVAAGPAARAELLRIIAESGDVTAEEGVQSVMGLSGTRFSIKAPNGTSYAFIVDPHDGYVLQSDIVSTEQYGDDEVGTFAVSTAFGRPEALTELPEAISSQVAQIPGSLKDSYEQTLAEAGVSEAHSPGTCSLLASDAPVADGNLVGHYHCW